MPEKDKIVVKSITKNLADVREFVEKAAVKYELKPEEISKIVLSVDEACTNIIKYSHKYNNNKSIEILIDKNNNTLVIEFYYEGLEFNPDSVELTDMKKYMSEHKIGGLGIQLIKKFMNKIEYEFIIPNRNHLKLIKYLS